MNTSLAWHPLIVLELIYIMHAVLVAIGFAPEVSSSPLQLLLLAFVRSFFAFHFRRPLPSTAKQRSSLPASQPKPTPRAATHTDGNSATTQGEHNKVEALG